MRLVPFYVAYAGCAVIRARAITFDMQTIILMLGFGMVVHYVIALMQERLFLRRRIRSAAQTD